jgi:hypothetical protein
MATSILAHLPEIASLALSSRVRRLPDEDLTIASWVCLRLGTLKAWAIRHFAEARARACVRSLAVGACPERAQRVERAAQDDSYNFGETMSQAQPARKQRPPIGVMAPSQRTFDSASA